MNQKITPEKMRLLRQMLSDRVAFRAIAARLGVAPATVFRWAKRLGYSRNKQYNSLFDSAKFRMSRTQHIELLRAVLDELAVFQTLNDTNLTRLRKRAECWHICYMIYSILEEFPTPETSDILQRCSHDPVLTGTEKARYLTAAIKGLAGGLMLYKFDPAPCVQGFEVMQSMAARALSILE